MGTELAVQAWGPDFKPQHPCKGPSARCGILPFKLLIRKSLWHTQIVPLVYLPELDVTTLMLKIASTYMGNRTWRNQGSTDIEAFSLLASPYSVEGSSTDWQEKNHQQSYLVSYLWTIIMTDLARYAHWYTGVSWLLWGEERGNQPLWGPLHRLQLMPWYCKLGQKPTAGETMGPGGKATTVITDWVSYQIISNYLTFKLAK